MSWRLLTDHGVAHHRGLALDDALTRYASNWDEPTLRLYTYTLCVLVGRFQHVASAVNLDRCDALGIPVNRRPSGGGAIVMGPDQLGIALIVPSQHERFSSRSQDLMAQCTSGLIHALAKMGVDTQFEGKNDLVTRGRKIAGLGLYQPRTGGRLFHASLLLDLDVGNMLNVLRTPFDASAADHERAAKKRITTIRDEQMRRLSMSDLVAAIQAGYAENFDVNITPAPLLTEEAQLAESLCVDQYSSKQWIYGSNAPLRDRVGQSSLRTEAGDLEMRVIFAGQTLKSVFVGGNFIASDRAVYDLENSLRWHVSDPDSIEQTVADSVARNEAAWDRITVDDITEALVLALQQPDRLQDSVGDGACFARTTAQIA